ncbi:GbsR/MarR family transcriptional regulator [Microbispora amethystogenes]|uniref:HTH-type transcriptional regulator MmpR5 n=1 Tax=Microbispora amethystogenes TaxID=1427754 RepID=A0ABQ4FE45_9ACTN|nr:transcriptional regulator [Microbispora amethystogenes]GIH33094.1 HTH-type transcriptional regulator MmpR5 [Microbispora amethystogenes]
MADDERLLEWAEQVAMHLARDGVPPIAGRILGWLMVCDPPEQSAGQISAAIGASRASLTMNLRLLTGMGFLTWRTRPGDRTMYYRMADDAWQAVVRQQVAGIASFLDITRRGLDLVGPDAERAARVRQAHATFAWMARVFEQAPPLGEEDR